jgi:hypothetical protein
MHSQKTALYHCAELQRPVRVVQHIEWASGIGDDEPEPVVVDEACMLASRCPKVECCPLND